MADSVNITAMPDNSVSRVAYDLMLYVKSRATDCENQKFSRKELLDLYAECRYAAAGYRDLPK
jgi:hypothetical protein